MSAASTGGASSSSAIRGILQLGNSANTTVEFVTISTLGNSKDFGDLTTGRASAAAASNCVRASIAGGHASPVPKDEIEYFQIMTSGNSIDFGDLSGNARSQLGGCSNGHGGLAG